MKKTRVNIDSPALGCKLGRAYQIMVNQLASALKEAGLLISTSEYMILRAIYSDEGLQQCDIADKVGKDKASVSRCVANLERKGLVSTTVVSHKCLKVYLTDKSREIEPKIMSVALKRHRALTDITTPEQLDIFTEVLNSIIATK